MTLASSWQLEMIFAGANGITRCYRQGINIATNAVQKMLQALSNPGFSLMSQGSKVQVISCSSFVVALHITDYF